MKIAKSNPNFMKFLCLARKDNGKTFMALIIDLKKRKDKI